MGGSDKAMLVCHVCTIRIIGEALYKKLEWEKCEFKVPTKTISEHSIYDIILHFYDYSKICT